VPLSTRKEPETQFLHLLEHGKVNIVPDCGNIHVVQNRYCIRLAKGAARRPPVYLNGANEGSELGNADEEANIRFAILGETN
jgi:hypothetical protein